MSRLRKFIVALIIIGLLPATTLAGSMRFCVAEDGHRQIEFVHGGHHQSETAAHIEHAAPCESYARSAEKTACVDFALLSASTAASPFGLIKKLVQADDFPPLAPWPPAVTWRGNRENSAPRHSWSTIGADLDEPRLLLLRTVVLLI